MKKEYQVVARKAFDPDRWWNVGMCLDNKRVYSTLNEAHDAVDRYLQQWNGTKVYDKDGERYETQRFGDIGVSICITKKDDERQRVIEIKIKSREVTEWDEEIIEI